MKVEIDMNTLLQLNIGEIKSLTEQTHKIGDVIDGKIEFVKHQITQNKIMENWSKDFMEEFDD